MMEVVCYAMGLATGVAIGLTIAIVIMKGEIL
jgi:hypothetical protein